MDAVIVVLIILGIILFLNYFLAKEFYAIAEMKGYEYHKKYFWYCFIFGWIGYLMVIALPNKTAIKKSVGDELPEL